MSNIDFENLYNRYFAGILGYFMKNFNHNMSLAEDLAQDTFAKILRHSRCHYGFVYTKQYLYKTAENVKYDYIRRGKGLPTVNIDAISLPLFADNLLTDNIDFCYTMLQPSERALFELLAEGYNSFELSRIFNVTPSAVRARIAKLKKVIRKNLIDF